MRPRRRGPEVPDHLATYTPDTFTHPPPSRPTVADQHLDLLLWCRIREVNGLPAHPDGRTGRQIQELKIAAVPAAIRAANGPRRSHR